MLALGEWMLCLQSCRNTLADPISSGSRWIRSSPGSWVPGSLLLEAALGQGWRCRLRLAPSRSSPGGSGCSPTGAGGRPAEQDTQKCLKHPTNLGGTNFTELSASHLTAKHLKPAGGESGRRHPNPKESQGDPGSGCRTGRRARLPRRSGRVGSGRMGPGRVG